MAAPPRPAIDRTSKPVLGPAANPPPSAGSYVTSAASTAPPNGGPSRPAISRASKPVLDRNTKPPGSLDSLAQGSRPPPANDEFSRLVFDRLALEDDDPTSQSLSRLRQAEAMNAEALASLQRQGEALNNVGYRLEDMDRTLEAGNHYLESCDGYFGALKTTVTGPKLRGRDLETNNPDGGPPLGPDGQPLPYGEGQEEPPLGPDGRPVGPDGRPLPYGYNAIEGAGPDLSVMPSATASNFSGVGSTQVSARAGRRVREDFAEQEQQLDEMNAILANINQMNATKKRELDRQDRQLDAVTAKQTETSYNVEKSSRKLNRLL